MFVEITSKTHRYGFNGKELDTEGMGGGLSTYDYGFRIYNPAICKFLSVDPRTYEYSWQAPYAYHRNNAMACIDYLGGGDPPITSRGVYFVVLKNPSADIVYNDFAISFTQRVQAGGDNNNLDDYTVCLQQFKFSNYAIATLRAGLPMLPGVGSNPATTLGQNVENGITTGEQTDNSRGYLAQDVDGNWQGGLGNPPNTSAVGFGGGIPVIVDGQKYGESETGEYCGANGYQIQNSTSQGKVVIGIDSSNNNMVIVVSPDDLPAGSGMTLDEVRDTLYKAGCNYAFSFDGGSSATLIQDSNNILVEPVFYKDNAIPVGVTLTEGK